MTKLIKKVVGKFKDEFNGDIVNEFVGLRAKLFSILTEKKIQKYVRVSTNV